MLLKANVLSPEAEKYWEDHPDAIRMCDLAMEAFRDDVLPALNVAREFHIDFAPGPNPRTLRVVWTWGRLEGKHTKDFSFHKDFSFRSLDTDDTFAHRFKSYLWDLVVSIINL